MKWYVLGSLLLAGMMMGVSGLLPDTSRAKSWIWLGNYASLYRQNDLEKEKRAFDFLSKARLFFTGFPVHRYR